jgi:hypothetical protein
MNIDNSEFLEILEISLIYYGSILVHSAVRRKARQLDEKALIEIELHQSIQDSRRFYKRLNDVRRPFEPQVDMCRAKNEELFTNKNQVLARWKEHFEEHLNEGSESRSNLHVQSI